MRIKKYPKLSWTNSEVGQRRTQRNPAQWREASLNHYSHSQRPLVECNRFSPLCTLARERLRTVGWSQIRHFFQMKLSSHHSSADQAHQASWVVSTYSKMIAKDRQSKPIRSSIHWYREIRYMKIKWERGKSTRTSKPYFRKSISSIKATTHNGHLESIRYPRPVH